MESLSQMYSILFLLTLSTFGSLTTFPQRTKVPCFAGVRSDGEYADWSGRRWEFYEWENRSVKGVKTKFLVGERLFSAPFDELKNMNSACFDLPEWQMPQDPQF